MIISSIKKIVGLCLLTLLSACDSNNFQEEIPYTTFPDIFIQLDLPQYNNLAVDGGHILLNEGVRGIILYRESSTRYHAYERNCSYLPYEAGSTVHVHSSGLYMTDPTCGSSFSFINGHPTSGPAQYPLREYSVSMDRRTLIITDDPTN